MTGETSNPEKRSDGISARGGLAAWQSTGLFGASERYALAHKLLTQFSPYFKSHHPYKQKKGTTARVVLFLLVRMTGFEPTRISSLERKNALRS